ncbi:MAG: glycosyltransferase family 4 protein [Chloroflexota bacterium]
MSKSQKKYCMVVHSTSQDIRVEREAEALVKAGYQVDILCLRYPNETAQEVINEITFYRLPIYRRQKWGIVGQFAEYIIFLGLAFFQLAGRSNYQVVHVHNLPDFLVFAALIPRLRGAKVVLDLHDLMPEFYESRFNKWYNRWLISLVRLQERLSCGFAHHVITVTEPWRQALIKRGVPEQKTSVVMNLPGKQFQQNLDHIKLAPQTEVEFRLLYHGGLFPRYGLDLLLQAIAQVKDELPNVRLIIHGNNQYRPVLEALADQLDITDVVTFSTDRLPIEELAQFIASAHAGLVPYRSDVFTDGILPTKLMEYVTVGLPVIAARTPMIETYFDDSMVAFFNPGNVDELVDRIRYFYHNRTSLTPLIQAARQFNQRYNWPDQAKHLTHLAETLTTH